MTDVVPKATKVVINMEYPGWAISKNGLWVGGVRRMMNSVALAWKKALAQSVSYAFLGAGVLEPKLPLTIEIRGFYASRAKACDTQNLIEIISDATEEATAINDLDYKIVSWPPTFKSAQPRIEITITAEVERGVGDGVRAITPSPAKPRKKEGGRVARVAAGRPTPRASVPCNDSTPQVTPSAGKGKAVPASRPSRKRSSATSPRRQPG